MEVKGIESATQRVQSMGWNPRRGKSHFCTTYRGDDGRVRTRYRGAVDECRELTFGDPFQSESGGGDERQGFGSGHWGVVARFRSMD